MAKGDLKTDDPGLYEYAYRQGVEAAERGASSGVNGFDYFVTREDVRNAQRDGFLARISAGTSEAKK